METSESTGTPLTFTRCNWNSASKLQQNSNIGVNFSITIFNADDGDEGSFSYRTSLYFDFHRIGSSSRSRRSSWYTSTILDRLISFECFTDGIMPNIEPAVIVNDENCSAK